MISGGARGKLHDAVSGAGESQGAVVTLAATVLGRDSDGTAYVHIPGGVARTPLTRASMDISAGDTVMVEFDGVHAVARENTTNPSAGVVSVSAASSKAESAATDAARARLAADSAVADAAIANAAANGAVTSLGVVEDIAGTLTWLADHGTYTLTQDTAVDPNKTYWTLDETSGTYSAVTSPTASGLSGYYELSIDETVTQYVASHLALTDSGLYLTTDGKAGKLLLSSEGVTLYGADGDAAATFGDSITFDSSHAFAIGTDDAYILFTPATDSAGASIAIGGSNVTFADTPLSERLQALADANSGLETRVADNEKALDGMQSLISIDTGEGSITLGGSNSVTARLDNDSLDFNTSAGTVATIGVDDGEGVMDVTRARISDSLEIGAGLWAWAPRNNGNLTLRWIGE